MLSNYRYGLLTSKLLQRYANNTILNTNIRIYGLKSAVIPCTFPEAESVLFDYCNSEVIYQNLKMERFPKLKELYIASCNRPIEYDMLDYPFNKQNVYSDFIYCRYNYDELANIFLHYRCTKDIHSVWDDDGFELLKINNLKK